jgi:AAA ATPase-like protein
MLWATRTCNRRGEELVALKLFGRRRELGLVERVLTRALAGSGGVLVVLGPRGAGKTALADAAVAAAGARGVPVTRTPSSGHGPRLIVLDEVALPAAAELDRLVDDGAAVLITATSADVVQRAELSPEVRDRSTDLYLAALDESDLVRLLPGLPGDVVHAIWLATGGLPGPALELAATSSTDEEDPVAALTLRVPSRSEFLVPDDALLRLLEAVAARPLPATVRARVLIRWARELLGDPSAAGRRRELADEAVRLARDSGDPGTSAEVLDGRLHALWDPVAAAERLSEAARIIEFARLAGDSALELRGLFWRFVALVELGDLDTAEAVLMTYARTGALTGDARSAVVALSRQAMLALVRGRLPIAAALTEEVAVAGRRAGLTDTARLTASLTGALAVLRGESDAQIGPLQQLARRLPGHFYEATAARVLVEAGREPEALLELDRMLPAVLTGTGPRWLGAVADLAFVASHGGDLDAAQKLFDVLTPYRGRLVVWGGANTVTGPVDDLLGRLANRLGRTAAALTLFDLAVAQEERLGALPWLCATLAVRGRSGDWERSRSLAARLGIVLGAPVASSQEWRLLREGDGWLLQAGTETASLRDVRGLHYLRTLVSAPGHEIAALDLVANGSGLRVPPGDPVLDAPARTAFRARLSSLDAQLDETDRTGDVTRATRLAAEKAAVTAELRAATGTGGRPRRHSAEAERARVNATRALSTVLNRLELESPLAAAHLRASLRTGNHFRYQPAPGGPQRWRLA